MSNENGRATSGALLPDHIADALAVDALAAGGWPMDMNGWAVAAAPLDAAAVAAAEMLRAYPQLAGDLFSDEVAADLAALAGGYLYYGAAAEFEIIGAAGGDLAHDGHTNEIVVPAMPCTVQTGEEAPRTQSHSHGEVRTTVRLRHLPRAIDVQGVCSMLDELGFSCAYDVVHVPGQRRQRLDRGYAFVNFLCPANAEACLRLCDRGSRERGSPSSCTAVYAECQGAGFVAKCMSAHFQKQLDPICRRGAVVDVT